MRPCNYEYFDMELDPSSRMNNPRKSNSHIRTFESSWTRKKVSSWDATKSCAPIMFSFLYQTMLLNPPSKANVHGVRAVPASRRQRGQAGCVDRCGVTEKQSQGPITAHLGNMSLHKVQMILGTWEGIMRLMPRHQMRWTRLRVRS